MWFHSCYSKLLEKYWKDRSSDRSMDALCIRCFDVQGGRGSLLAGSVMVEYKGGVDEIDVLYLKEAAGRLVEPYFTAFVKRSSCICMT